MFVVFLAGLFAFELSAETKRDWHLGKMVKVDAVDIVPSTHAQRFYYTIDTGTCSLIVTEKVLLRGSQPLQASEGDIVKWAMHKKDVYVVAGDSKERVLSLRRQDCK
jgi:hypothetical protein